MTDTTTIPTWPKLSLPHGLLPGTLLAANVFVRSAMFSTLDYAGSARRPDVLESLKISAIAPYDVEQVGGSRLSQSDADLLFWLLARAYRGGPPRGPARVYFRRAEALAALQRKRGGKTDALLDVSLIRLSRAEFVAKFHAVNSKFRLLACVERVEREEKQYDYWVDISGGVAELLACGEWLLIGEERGLLAGDSLARGLHAFYTSHKSAYPMLPSTLKAIMGRESMQNSKWRRALDAALLKVRGVTGWWQCEVVKTGPHAGKVVVLKGRKPKTLRRPAINKAVPDAN